MGPEGLVAMRAAGEGLARDTPAYDRWRDAMTGVSRQLHADVSDLYWYTDLDKATQAAQEQDKPILSLRLLGELDEAFSCANSRLFRAILYPDPAVSNYLSEHFILHWSSERPAPRVTIDMGDGRLLQRTITGNSVHYVLDDRGRPVDAFIGLSTPERFVEGLEGARDLALQSSTRSGAERTRLLTDYHLREQQENREAFAQVMRRTGQRGTTARAKTPIKLQREPVPANLAMPMTVGKSRMEAPMLADFDLVADPDSNGADPTAFDPRQSNVDWGAIAERERFALSEPSRRLIRSERPLDHIEPFPSRAVKLDELLASLENVVMRDSVRNEYQMRPQVHDLFLAGLEDFDRLNETIYANVLRTPASDPWLGLIDSNVYMGLDRGGVLLPGDLAGVAPGTL